jgi:beta-barrel assembly-enhancing protease
MRISLLLAAALLTSCTASTRESFKRAETSVAKALISDEQEKQIGEQVHHQLEQGSPESPPIKYSTDPVVNTYVQNLVTRLQPFADKDRKSEWHVHVIDDPKTVNAFATPGGHLYVYNGLLLAADNEAEVVGVMGHEMGHVVGRHSARQMVNALGLNVIASLALGKEPGQLARLAAAAVGNGTMLAHSRSDENEADQYAVKYSAAAGYDPSGIATFFEKLKAKQGNTPRVLTWLSTHPAPADRIVKVNQAIARQRLTGRGETGAGRLDPIKARINARLPVSAR